MACLAARIADRLTGADAELLTEWLTTGTDDNGAEVSAQRVADALTTDRHKIGPHTLRDHRRQACACYPGEVTP